MVYDSSARVEVRKNEGSPLSGSMASGLKNGIKSRRDEYSLAVSFLAALSPLVTKITRISGSLMTHGSGISSADFKNYYAMMLTTMSMGNQIGLRIETGSDGCELLYAHMDN